MPCYNFVCESHASVAQTKPACDPVNKRKRATGPHPVNRTKPTAGITCCTCAYRHAAYVRCPSIAYVLAHCSLISPQGGELLVYSTTAGHHDMLLHSADTAPEPDMPRLKPSAKPSGTPYSTQARELMPHAELASFVWGASVCW